DVSIEKARLYVAWATDAVFMTYALAGALESAALGGAPWMLTARSKAGLALVKRRVAQKAAQTRGADMAGVLDGAAWKLCEDAIDKRQNIVERKKSS
ncbi:unnamed protein product, partial [Prorocentrum cordatum]